MRSSGTFFYGDTINDLIVRVKLVDGTYQSFAAATLPILTWSAPDGTTGTVSGAAIAFEQATVDGVSIWQCRVENPGTFLNPGQRRRVAIDFLLSWTASTETGKAREVGRFEIARFP